MIEVMDILDSEMDKLYSKNTVRELSEEGVSEYKRGQLAGKLEMLNIILIRIGDNETKTVRNNR